MPTIYRPKSNRAREKALNMITNKNNSIPAVDRFFTTSTTSRMNARQVVVHDDMHLIATTNRDMNEASRIIKLAFKPDVVLIKDFLTGLFKLVKRTNTIDDVALYHIAVGDLELPKLTEQSAVALWGGYLSTGETDRVALAGRVAMSNPTIADVMVGVNDFATKKNIQSNFKDDNGNAKLAMDADNIETDKVLKTAQDEVQVHFGEGTPEAKRRQGREYGLVWVSTIMKTFTITVLDNLTGLPLDLSHVELIETGKAGNTGVAGTVAINSTIMDLATFHASHPDYNDNEAAVVVHESTLVYAITIRLTHV